jgi:hypothetical protein
MTKANKKISALKAAGTFLKKGTCSESIMHLLDQAFDNTLVLEENASMPLAGGIIQHGYQCGMVWGATLAAGAQAHRLYGSSPQAECMAIIATQRAVDAFRTRYNTINCFEITNIDKSSSTMEMIKFFLLKGGTINCLRMAGKYAPVAFTEIKAALSDEDIEAPSTPVSCSAVLAQKMGLTDIQTVMAAGLAGGIGLSGGGCGALGTAIWILGMNVMKDKGKIDFKAPGTQELIDKFLIQTDFKFECSEIVGRNFNNINDHSDYLNKGGCAELIDLLASELSTN